MDNKGKILGVFCYLNRLERYTFRERLNVKYIHHPNTGERQQYKKANAHFKNHWKLSVQSADATV